MRRRPTLGRAGATGWGSVLGVLPAGSVRRRPSDVGRVLVAAAVVATLLATARRSTRLEQATYDLVQALPDGMGWCFRLLEGAGSIVTVAVVAAAALATRRLRLAISLAAAGLSAWGLAVALAAWVDAPAALAAEAATVGGAVPDAPSVRLAVVSAVLLTARPYLTKPARSLASASIVVVAVSYVYVTAGLPVGLLASVVLGWGIAALVHLAVGSPDGVPSAAAVTDALAGLDIAVTDLALAPEQSGGETTFVGRGSDGAGLRVAVIGRDARDGQLLTKLWRNLWYRDAASTVTLTRQQQIEHRAFLLLVAADGGVAGPELVAAGTAGRRTDAVLVLAEPTGPTFGRAGADGCTDAVLDDAWHQLALLHASRLAHGAIGPEAVIATDDGTAAFVDLPSATAGPSEAVCGADRVALLVTTATVTDHDRALAAAERALGADGLVELLPVLQVAALPAATTRHVDDAKGTTAALRQAIADRTGTEEPPLVPLTRVSLGQLFMAAATILGVYLLFGQLAQVDWATTFEDAIWAWIPVVFVFSQLPQLGTAIATQGAVSAHLPYKPLLIQEYAKSFTGLVGGTVANTALVVRFFQKQGLGPSVAVSSGVLSSLAGGVVQAILVTAGLLLTSASFDVGGGSEGGDLDGGRLLLLAVVVVGAVSGVILLVPRLRHRIGATVGPQVRASVDNLKAVLRSPRKGLELFGGNLIAQLFFALTLGAALHAYGESLPVLELIVINSLASLLGGVAPVPGGMGVIEAGLIGGFTAAGIPQEQAVAATFTARTFTAYLPPIWGWFALRWLRQHDDA